MRRLFLIPALTAGMFWSPLVLHASRQEDVVPQDSAAEPARVSITAPFEVFVNGKVWQGHTIGWHLNHPADTDYAIWLGLPGRGMYILSLVPREKDAFQKAGVVQGNVITFHDGVNQYQIRTSGTILPSDGARALYLLHRADMEMKGPLFGVDRIGSCTLGYLK